MLISLSPEWVDRPPLMEEACSPSPPAPPPQLPPALPPPPPLSSGCEDHWSWNKSEKSHEIRLNGPKNRIAHFHPNWSNGTAGIRGTRVLNKGRYYWEVNVSQRIFGTRFVKHNFRSFMGNLGRANSKPRKNCSKGFHVLHT